MQPRLRQLELFVTQRCTLSCSYCFRGADRGRLPPDLDPALADRAVDLLCAGDGGGSRLRLELWGGEPFLRPDLIARVAARARGQAASAGRELSLAAPTNLTRLDEAALDLVERWAIELSLSLDGPPEAHVSRLAPDGSPGWPLVERGLFRLLDRYRGRPLPPVRMTVTPARAGELADDVAGLQALGFARITFLPASGLVWDAPHTALLDAQLALLAERLVEVVRRGHPPAAPPPHYPHLLRRLAPLYVAERTGLPPPRRAGYCGAGGSLLAVDTLGELYPCHRLASRPNPPAELKLGSVSEGITRPGLVRQLATLSADDPAVRCASCPRRPRCGVLCLAQNHQRTGNPAEVPDEACWVNERLLRAAERIHAALAGDPSYGAYLEPLLAADPDDRLLPLLARLQHEPEPLLERAAALLGSAARPAPLPLPVPPGSAGRPTPANPVPHKEGPGGDGRS